MFSTEIVTSDEKVDEVRMEAAEKREGEDERVSEEEEVREGTRGGMRPGKIKDKWEMGKGNEENVNTEEGIEHQVHSIIKIFKNKQMSTDWKKLRRCNKGVIKHQN